MKRLRVGVVGTGYLGQFHAQKYALMEDVDLVGVVDVDGERADRVAAETGSQAFADYRRLFGKVDAVSIVVPTPLHFAVGRDFLAQDIDVLIEKPLTTALREADELVDFAEERGLILQVGHLERFNPAVVALEGIVRKPMFIECHRLSIFKPRCTDVSVVLDLMIHDIDLILNFVKTDVKEIRAAGVAAISAHVDIANARLEFESGCVANVTASRISTKNERKIRLFQKDAYISVDFARREITVISKDGEPQENSLIPGMGIRQMHFSQGDALEDELRAFVESVRRREMPAVSGKVGRDALEIALSINEQISRNSSRLLG